jgi:cell wall-associated NlpC family hydrolase
MYGIVTLSNIPMRKEANHRSEMVSQLLFGETYQVLSKTRSWLYIKCSYDDYEGWIDDTYHNPIHDKDKSALLNNQYSVALDIVNTAATETSSPPIVAGSTLPQFDGLNFKIGKEKFVYNGQALQQGQSNFAIIEKLAMRYLNAPYLWGGRSPFGIDCSGFTQVIFKSLFIPLKRDAYQQAEQGRVINFVEETQPGDLAFFANESGSITHVGIVIKDRFIIHASGRVRIDKLDHFGIYNAERKKYSHQLKIIKRMV